MKRYVKQFILMAFFGFIATTGFLTAGAADQSAGIISDVGATSAPTSQMPEPVKADAIATDYQGTKTAVYRNNSTTINVTITRGSYITIGGHTIPIFDTDSTATDAGSRVARYGGKFLFGHNTSAVFGHLAGLPVGTEFSVTIDGNTTNYQIAQRVLFAHEQGSYTLTPIDPAGAAISMVPIVNASYKGSYDLSIMTCAGISYGGGDASERLVLFARQV